LDEVQLQKATDPDGVPATLDLETELYHLRYGDLDAMAEEDHAEEKEMEESEDEAAAAAAEEEEEEEAKRAYLARSKHDFRPNYGTTTNDVSQDKQQQHSTEHTPASQPSTVADAPFTPTFSVPEGMIIVSNRKTPRRMMVLVANV
jgi:hypothetical protein